MHRLEELRAFDSPLYEAEDDVLTAFFTVRTAPTPDCFLASAANMKTETAREIYVGMQGASEFTIGGVMRDLNLTGSLPQISNPVLLVSGRFDTMRPPTVDAMYKSLPRAWRAEMPRSGHCTMTDDPRLTNDIVGEFLDRVEGDGLSGFQMQIDQAIADSLGQPSSMAAAAATGASPPVRSLQLPLVPHGLLLLAAGVAVGAFAGPWLAPRYYARTPWAESARADLTAHLSK
uniref:Peptidase S33 tripeptidyl aminopeptidase-like C-terminal domain-containing protein n=1 Tax=Alexandrium catenella TaxID=2925 RepID=A0A7S1L9J1_ALECA